MSAHEFILQPGLWIGEGKVTFSASPERLRFYTKWSIEAQKRGTHSCSQQVEMEGGSDHVNNSFIFSDFHDGSFIVELTSELLGTVMGKGVIDAKTIAWEFRGNPEFEGFEVYELQDNGDYMLHAEYSSSELIRTIIDGRIWRKGKSST